MSQAVIREEAQEQIPAVDVVSTPAIQWPDIQGSSSVPNEPVSGIPVTVAVGMPLRPRQAKDLMPSAERDKAQQLKNNRRCVSLSLSLSRN